MIVLFSKALRLVMGQTNLLFSAKWGFFLRIKAAAAYSSPVTSI
jgi:hypothetical protein